MELSELAELLLTTIQELQVKKEDIASAIEQLRIDCNTQNLNDKYEAQCANNADATTVLQYADRIVLAILKDTAEEI